jgi:hypothetical protein
MRSLVLVMWRLPKRVVYEVEWLTHILLIIRNINQIEDQIYRSLYN